MDIKTMFENGVGISEIARRLGRDRKTVRKWLNSGGPPRKIQRRRPSKLDPFKDYILERMHQGVLNASVIFDEIKDRGYAGGTTVLRDFMQPYRPVLQGKATIRYETEPGHQAQADWAHFGRVIDQEGNLKPLYCFVMVLSYSRMLYLEFTTAQDSATLLRCHLNAFDFFGGIPREILYDNAKTIVTGRDAAGSIIFNERFLDFSVHFNFRPKVCPPYRARTKGKVERPIRYIRENFFAGRTFDSLNDINAQAAHWRDHKANVRIHATTLEAPVSRWGKELLNPLAGVPEFDLAAYHQRRVSSDSMVSYQSNFYSVPWELVGRDVLLRITDEQLQVYWQGQKITQHRLIKDKRFARNQRSEHYQGLPGRNVPQSKRSALTVFAPPEVEKRPLDFYETLVREGAR